MAERGTSPIIDALRVEDGLLAAWSIGVPIIGTALGATSDRGSIAAAGPVVGVVELVAVLGAVAALLTRPPGQPPVQLGDREGPRWIIAGPLVGALAFVSGDAVENLGLGSGNWLLPIALLAILVGTIAADRLPTVTPWARRGLVLPFILVSASFFDGLASVFVGALDIPDAIAASPPGELGFTVFVLALVVAGAAVFYAMFVVAPRELADPEGSGSRWLIRFVLFLVASVLGAGWLGYVAG